MPRYSNLHNIHVSEPRRSYVTSKFLITHF